MELDIRKALQKDIDGIAEVCSAGFRQTYPDIYSQEFIERAVSEFYNRDRIMKDIAADSKDWQGYYVALIDDVVVGAIGGGMRNETESEIYVFYLNPDLRNRGIGTQLLNYFTEIQKTYGAEKQWVSVTKGNQKGIPFYERKGFIKMTEEPSWFDENDEGYIDIKYMRNL